MAGTVTVPVILRISLHPALQRLIRAVRCQRRMTAPGRDRVGGCPACNNVVGRYGRAAGTYGLNRWASRGIAPLVRCPA